MTTLSRRTFVFGAAAGSLTVFSRTLRAADFSFVQYHNQTTESSLHIRLTEMWNAIGLETQGRVETRVFPGNNNVQGSDPTALRMLVAGEIQFFTLMGGLLGAAVPVAEVQQVPFAFRSAEHAFQAIDGALGAYLREEMTAKGIHGFAVGGFDNGMRQLNMVPRPITVPADLQGLRIRVPAGKMFEDLFRTFGAEPVTINSNAIHEALKTGKADGQENPLALIDLFKLYEVTRYVSITNHMWSGFNQLAHLPTWRRLPDDIRAVIDRNVTTFVKRQRQDQAAANAKVGADLKARGLVFNDVDVAPFRRQLSGFYGTWKKALGPKCWTLLESASGRTLA